MTHRSTLALVAFLAACFAAAKTHGAESVRSAVVKSTLAIHQNASDASPVVAVLQAGAKIYYIPEQGGIWVPLSAVVNGKTQFGYVELGAFLTGTASDVVTRPGTSNARKVRPPANGLAGTPFEESSIPVPPRSSDVSLSADVTRFKCQEGFGGDGYEKCNVEVSLSAQAPRLTRSAVATVDCDFSVEFRKDSDDYLPTVARSTETETVNIYGGSGSTVMYASVRAPTYSMDHYYRAKLKSADCQVSSIY